MDIYSQIRTLYEKGEYKQSMAIRPGITKQIIKKYCNGTTHPEVCNQTMVTALIDRLTLRSHVLNVNSDNPYLAEYAAAVSSGKGVSDHVR